MSHENSYRGSYSAAFQLVMQRILRPRSKSVQDSTLVYPHVTSDIYRSGAEFHRGIDFNYVGGQLAGNPQTLNVSGQMAVYAPVTGTVVALLPDFGGVVIQNETDGTFHRLLHLAATAVSDLPPNNRVIAGETQLGTMGGRGSSGPTQYDVHVHYDIFLDAGPAGYQGVVNGVDIDNRIDPLVYWTSGVNPNASLDAQGNPTGTGLLVYAVPVSDVNGNGVIDTSDSPGAVSESGAFVREGQASYLKLGVNTPHTRPITLRLTLNQWAEGFNVEGVDAVTVTSDPNTSTVYYVTLPPTADQSNPNTSGYVRLVLGEDADAASQIVTYTVEAGYLNGGSFTAYVPNLFAPITDRSLFILDNDIPQEPTDINVPPVWDAAAHAQRNGTELSDRAGAPQIFEDKASDPSYKLYLGKDKTVSDIPADEMTRIRFGAAAADQLYGSTQWDHLYGLAGNDTLQGKLGNDYLEGGQGNDTYIYTSNDGLDTILDTDGLGKIRFDGTNLTGGDKLFGETYKSSDGKYLYTLLQKTAGQDLLISGMGGQIIVGDFQEEILLREAA